MEYIEQVLCAYYTVYKIFQEVWEYKCTYAILNYNYDKEILIS